MERLTRRINGVVVYVGAKNPYSTGQIPCEVEPAGVREMMDCLAAYEDTGWTPEMLHKLGENAGHLWDFAQAAENMTVGRLKELAEADKDGRVVILPCKVGDTVWFKTYKNNARDCIGVQPHEVTRISASIIVPGEIVDIGIPVDQIGVRVFLSETEAVAADAKPPAGNSILEV